MHERQGAEREYLCNICGEVFRSIFPLQAHQGDKHQVGAGKRRRTNSATTNQPKRARVSEGILILCCIIVYIVILYIRYYVIETKNLRCLPL